MYKLVVLDLDGTLLTSDKKISNYTCNVLKSIKDKVKIVLASARGFNTIKPYLKQLELLNSLNYTIAFNGSLVVNNVEDKLIDNSITKNNIQLLENYIEENNELEWYYYTYEDRFKRDRINNVSNFIIEETIYKVVCISDEISISKLRASIPKEIDNLFQITSSEPTRIEFVEKGMTKLEAIKKLLNDLDIDVSEVIAIGDGENDIDMIKFAGCGIAMNNASKEVKDIANMITETNDNDGVGKILERLLLK